MVKTENEEKHNELVEEILRRIEENNLYVKSKYKQRIREVDFLGVVIGSDEIKMEKEKVKTVVDWPISKSVKDI